MSARAQRERKRILKARAEAEALLESIKPLDLIPAEKLILRLPKPPSALVIAWLGYLTHLAYAAAEKSRKQAEAARARHAGAKKRARELANEFRELKPNERITEAVAFVVSGFKNEGLPAYTDDTIHGWIRDLFPSHLRSRGRPPKE